MRRWRTAHPAGVGGAGEHQPRRRVLHAASSGRARSSLHLGLDRLAVGVLVLGLPQCLDGTDAGRLIPESGRGDDLRAHDVVRALAALAVDDLRMLGHAATAFWAARYMRTRARLHATHVL